MIAFLFSDVAEGANVAIRSRKADNVNKAVSDLKKEGLSVIGIPCHVVCFCTVTLGVF